jgi:hypothetical protein
VTGSVCEIVVSLARTFSSFAKAFEKEAEPYP